MFVFRPAPNDRLMSVVIGIGGFALSGMYTYLTYRIGFGTDEITQANSVITAATTSTSLLELHSQIIYCSNLLEILNGIELSQAKLCVKYFINDGAHSITVGNTYFVDFDIFDATISD